MPRKKISRSQNAPRGNSRAAQNRAIRRHALRESLKSSEYIRQLTLIADRLEPEAENAFTCDQIPAVKVRIDLLFGLLRKTLPDLRPLDAPITFTLEGDSLADQGASVIKAVAAGELSVTDGKDLLASLSAQVRIVEFDELSARVTALEGARER